MEVIKEIPIKCPVCNGTGEYKGKECKACNGKGIVVMIEKDYYKDNSILEPYITYTATIDPDFILTWYSTDIIYDNQELNDEKNEKKAD